VPGSSEAVEESVGENSPDSQSHLPLRANSTTQVCWHRTTTVGMADMQTMLKVVTATLTVPSQTRLLSFVLQVFSRVRWSISLSSLICFAPLPLDPDCLLDIVLRYVIIDTALSGVLH